MHDADTSTFVHYCYKPEEMLMVKYQNKLYYITFAELYTLINEEEKYDITIQQNAKFPINPIDLQGLQEYTEIMAKTVRNTRIKKRKGVVT